ncbi:membrane protein insertase YidC [Clostridium fermenticellae]|uniref:Membrane protein insertase YidC n=1 Tax=Clostridium fermenticellae TaxID=2068654 RepID=A0A386H6N0_9CLOT|nr:membrane protein insertase YidC [Clostridium fermenticellae]AYD41379.1 membrane protein insertase YidC [Clostridium fermenticellae]
MRYLSNAFVQFFNFIHQGVMSLIPNQNISYGITIILVTVIIRLIILPLNLKQMKSSIIMNEVQPELQKIQNKYKNDPQKAQEKMMKLYKENGVNPLGGCLPMLIQWPIFIALYYVFNNLQGINGVHFLWIQDLAKRDIILALLSGITTYYSGILMMPAGDSAQAKNTTTMNIAMSGFMVFISWSLKSALVLYWVVNNLIQIAQTLVIKRFSGNKNHQ